MSLEILTQRERQRFIKEKVQGSCSWEAPQKCQEEKAAHFPLHLCYPGCLERSCGGELDCVPAPHLFSTPVATWPLPLASWSPWLRSPRPCGGPRSPHPVRAQRSRAAAESWRLLRLGISRRGQRTEACAGSSQTVVESPPSRLAPPLPAPPNP
jgi:hypothetical protein